MSERGGHKGRCVVRLWVVGGGSRAPGDGRRLTGAAIVLITLAGLVTACSDDDPPPPPPGTQAVNTSAAPSPTATRPTLPEAKPTAESAEAFVRYFWDVYNYSYRTLDTELLEAISSSACQFCRSTEREVADLKADRKRVVGGEIRLGTVATPPGDPSNGVIVTMVLDQESGQTINDDGTVSSSLPAIHNMRSEVALRWQSTWSVYGVANDEKTGTR